MSNPYIGKLEALLRANLTIESLEIVDDSAKHRGHAGFKEGGNSHFTLKIKALELSELSKVAQHRLIYKILGEELKNQIHALAIEVM